MLLKTTEHLARAECVLSIAVSGLLPPTQCQVAYIIIPGWANIFLLYVVVICFYHSQIFKGSESFKSIVKVK